MTFKSEHPFEKRVETAQKIRTKYPNRIPVIVEKVEGSDVPEIEKKKFLVPDDITVGKLVYEIRKNMKLSADKAIFLFVGNTTPSSSATMDFIYSKYRDEDGFLYVKYSNESTFGSR